MVLFIENGCTVVVKYPNQESVALGSNIPFLNVAVLLPVAQGLPVMLECGQ